MNNREIDALVAEKVMGLVLEDYEEGRIMPCPKYSSDFLAAMDVAKKTGLPFFIRGVNFQEYPMATCLAALKAEGVEVEVEGE